MCGHKRKLGQLGEDLAANYYLNNGAEVRGRNISYPCGEIDLVIEESDGTIVFVEVKTRSSTHFGVAESVTDRKLHRIRRAAASWLQSAHAETVRFDVVAIIFQPETDTIDIEVFKGVDSGSR